MRSIETNRHKLNISVKEHINKILEYHSKFDTILYKYNRLCTKMLLLAPYTSHSIYLDDVYTFTGHKFRFCNSNVIGMRYIELFNKYYDKIYPHATKKAKDILPNLYELVKDIKNPNNISVTKNVEDTIVKDTKYIYTLGLIKDDFIIKYYQVYPNKLTIKVSEDKYIDYISLWMYQDIIDFDLLYECLDELYTLLKQEEVKIDKAIEFIETEHEKRELTKQLLKA